MIEIKICLPARIDPEIRKLFPPGFLQDELSHHQNVTAVKANRYLFRTIPLLKWVGGKECPAAWFVEKREIHIDPSIPLEDLTRWENASHGIPFFTLSEGEVWPFIFLHECCHSDEKDNERDEDRCNRYAKDRIFFLRGEKRCAKEAQEQALRAWVRTIVQDELRTLREKELR